MNINDKEDVEFKDFVKSEYKTYQIYSLNDRAIPHLIDGLKPSQRRVLYTLWKNRTKGLMKVTGATGLTLTLHPHGPASIESVIVNLAQDFTFRNNYPLVSKKGYFGARMETSAAAGRYIECQLSDIGKHLLFEKDVNQWEMSPNYDEKEMEPDFLIPKLPLMLLNGSEGIGTGFSSMIPNFHHKDIIKSMINFIEKGKASKIKPWYNNYSRELEFDNQKIIFNLHIERLKDGMFITELPKGYDAKKISKFLEKFIEDGTIKDYEDHSKENQILIKLVFKRGYNPQLKTIQDMLKLSTSMTPNYTLIENENVLELINPEEIIEKFTAMRIVVTKKRYELLIKEANAQIELNNEIIRFIKEKHYAQAEKKMNKTKYLDYLKIKKFKHRDYLAMLPIYRMTKEEVSKQDLLVKENKIKVKEFKKVIATKNSVKKALIEELKETNTFLNAQLKKM